jgi:hypothetical protein
MDPNDAAVAQLHRALRDVDWEALLPKLFAYARRRLRRMGWASGRDTEASKMSVEQLVNTAIERCLDGSRTWDPKAVDLEGFLRGAIRSVASSEKEKSVGRSKHDEAATALSRDEALIGSREDAQVEEEDRRALLEAVAACADEPDLRAYLDAVLDGNVKREEIAEALGWTGERVSAARIKLQRRLVRSFPETFAAVRDGRRRAS